MAEVLAVIIDGVIYSSWLFITALGLTLVYGVMKILNMAHGSLYALGAYAAASLGGRWLAAGHAPWGSYAVLLLAALTVGLVAGPAIERGILRLMYGREEIVLVLATYALFLILEDVIKLIWGVDPYFFSEPYGLLGSVELGGLSYPLYNVALLFVSVVTGGLLAWSLGRTRRGKMLLAIIHDREMSAALGMNVRRVYLITFTLGATLAAIGGALTSPTVAVAPGIGVEVVVLAFAVVVIGGLGSFAGAALGALIVGMVRSCAVHYLPQVELFSIYVAMALVLIARPKGLFSGLEPRRI